MRSIFLVILANWNRNRSSHLVMGVTVFISSFLLVMALILLMNLSSAFDNMLTKHRAANLLLEYSMDQYAPDELELWWSTREEVRSLRSYPLFRNDDILFINGDKREEGVYISEWNLSESTWNAPQDRLYITEALFPLEEAPPYPQGGTLWVSSILAKTQGVKPGDTLGVSTPSGRVDMTVAALVLDPQMNSQWGIKRLWLGPGEFYRIASPVKENDQILAIRLENPEQIEGLLSQFQNHLGGSFQGDISGYDEIKNDYLMIFNIIGFVIVAISLISLIIAWLMLSGNLMAFIRDETRQIGILRALGYSVSMVRLLYYLQIMGLILISMIAGILAGLLLGKGLLQSMADQGGLSLAKLRVIGPVAMASISLLVLSSVLILRNVFRAGRIQPSRAIRFGYLPRGGQGNSGISLKGSKLALPWFLGIRSLFRRGSKGFQLVVPLVLMIFIASLSIHGVFLLEKSISDRQFWGVVDAHASFYYSGVLLERQDDRSIAAYLEDQEEVEALLMGGPLISGFISQEGAQPFSIIGYAFSQQMDELGLVNLRGEHPLKADEIALTDRVMEKYHWQIGDTMTLFLEGMYREYRITGVFQCTDNLGYSFRIHESAYRVVQPRYQASTFYTALKEGADREALIQRVESRFGTALDGVVTSNTIRGIEQDFSSTMPYIKMLFALISFIFFLISFVIIQNNSSQYIQENRKDLGIYKTLGFSPGQLRASMLIRTGLMLGLCLVPGIALSIWLSPLLLSMVFHSSGFGAFSTEIHWWGILLFIPLLTLFGFLSTWGPSGKILKIRISDLIRE